MRRVFARWLLVGVLAVAPSAFALESTDTSLWSEFVMWLEAGGGGAADQVAYSFWLMSRLVIPGG